MPVGDYYQKYGPVHRRRKQGELPSKDEPPRRGKPPEKPEPPQEKEKKPQENKPRKPRSRWNFSWRLPSLRSLLIAFVVALCITPLILPYAIHLYYYNRALPGVSVQGLLVDDLDQQSITTVVASQHMSFKRSPLTLTFHQQQWAPTLADLGATIDAEATAAEAIHVGKHGNPIHRIATIWDVWRHGKDIAPHISLDTRALQDYLKRVAESIEYSPDDAKLSVAGGIVSTTPSVIGLQLLIDNTAQDIVLALHTLEPQDVVLRTRVLPPIIDDDAVATAAIRAEDILSKTVVLTYQKEIVWNAEKIAEMIQITPVEHRLQVEIDSERLAKATARIAEQIDSGSVEPRLGFAEGELRAVEPGRDGWRVKQEAAVRRIKNTLLRPATKTRTIVLPIEELQPQITPDNFDDLGIVELVGEGKSSFEGSAEYRITNIVAGASRLDGVLIAPGEEFSFNTQMGTINAENGFVEGYAIIGNRTQLEWGGGVCQDSTTVFRAAFWAGLPITERHAHPFYISWYDRYAYGDNDHGPGMDATIYIGISDLRFINDTGHWLLMQTDVDLQDEILSVQLYGTRPNRKVSIDGPYISNQVPAPSQPVYIDDPTMPQGTLFQSDAARNGRDIVVHRIITKDGVEIASTAFFTRFKPWADVYVRGTGNSTVDEEAEDEAVEDEETDAETEE